MDVIKELFNINFPYILISVFIILIGFKSIVSILEWFISKLGLETKWMRQKREEHELLIKTSENITIMQGKHAEDILQIQKELKDSIKSIVDRNLNKDKQIENLMVAQREALADRINQKYKYYISIKGIPEDEVDEFTNLHTAYKGVGGNHSGDAKYEYCMNHLQVIPVETKLVIKENE